MSRKKLRLFSEQHFLGYFLGLQIQSGYSAWPSLNPSRCNLLPEPDGIIAHHKIQRLIPKKCLTSLLKTACRTDHVLGDRGFANVDYRASSTRNLILDTALENGPVCPALLA
jgi:hypothetical protein